MRLCYDISNGNARCLASQAGQSRAWWWWARAINAMGLLTLVYDILVGIVIRVQ